MGYSVQCLGFKGLSRIGGGDQADIFNLIQNSQNTVVHLLLKVDEERWRVAQGSKRQVIGYDPHVRNLSGLRHNTPRYYAILLMHSKKNMIHALGVRPETQKKQRSASI